MLDIYLHYYIYIILIKHIIMVWIGFDQFLTSLME